MFKKWRIYSFFIVLLLSIVAVLGGCSSGKTQEENQELDSLNQFMAFTTNEEAFTQESFEEYDITLVCFWAPWSDASMYELQRLHELSKKLPDSVGFVTIALDSTAAEISGTLKNMEMTKVTTLCSGDGDFRIVCDEIKDIPTTMIVDEKGTRVKDPIIGIQDDFEKTYMTKINKALNSVGKKKISLE